MIDIELVDCGGESYLAYRRNPDGSLGPCVAELELLEEPPVWEARILLRVGRGLAVRHQDRTMVAAALSRLAGTPWLYS